MKKREQEEELFAAEEKSEKLLLFPAFEGRNFQFSLSSFHKNEIEIYSTSLCARKLAVKPPTEILVTATFLRQNARLKVKTNNALRYQQIAS